MAAKRLLSRLICQDSSSKFRVATRLPISRLLPNVGLERNFFSSYICPATVRHNQAKAKQRVQTCLPYSTDTAGFNADIQERVMSAIAQYDKISSKASELKLETRFKEDLSMDSLDHIEMITLVEDEFGIEIPDRQLEKMDTPAKVIEYLHTIDLPQQFEE